MTLLLACAIVAFGIYLTGFGRVTTLVGTDLSVILGSVQLLHKTCFEAITTSRSWNDDRYPSKYGNDRSKDIFKKLLCTGWSGYIYYVVGLEQNVRARP